MQDFSIYIDSKITIWERCKWSIRANNEEEAREKAMELYNSIEGNSDEAYALSSYMGQNYLDDTAEPMSIEENGGQSTIEVLVNGIEIFTNAEKQQI